MNDGYGKLFLLFLAIGLIFLAASGKGRAVWAAITSKTPKTSQPIVSSNPTDPKQPINGGYTNNPGGR